MAKLFLIGNGFDLAHGLKSSFRDFILDYLGDCYLKYCQYRSFEDENISIVNSLLVSYGQMEFKSPKDFHELCRNTGSTPIYKNKFLESIIFNKGPIHWADLEYLFFTTIRENVLIPEKVDANNDGLRTLTMKFEEYMEKELDQFTFKEIHEMRSVLNVENLSNEDSLYLNFNYTSILQQYITPLALNVNHIHGQLGDNQNPPIMGYGDDYHEDYQNFKNLNNNRVFDYSKSTWYLRNSNYNHFLDWINKDSPFDVHIIGHSCGLSDRVLLKMIFEHDNCHNIWIHYYQDMNGYLETAINISRHFDDPVKYRERLTSFDKNSPCPQLGD